MHLDYRSSTTDCITTAVASMRRTEALASVKFYQILSIFIFFIRLIILEDFIRLISYNGPCVRLGCSFFLATALITLAILKLFWPKLHFQPLNQQAYFFLLIWIGLRVFRIQIRSVREIWTQTGVALSLQTGQH